MQLEQGFKPKPFRPVPGKGSKAKEKAKEANKKLPTILPQHKNKRSSRVSSSSTPTNSNEKLRELSSTPFLSWYWFVWRQASWEVFLDGSKYRSFDKAKREQNFKDLEKRPGVYGFCIALPGSRKHFKVYAGYSSNILNRHANNYQKHGSHLLSYFESCLRRGYTIMRRVKYCKTAEKAKALESRLLNLWDYPWNKLENGNKREVFLQANLCLCFTTSVTVKSNDNKRS